jgi:RNA polymerase sigma-70 factor (ECF subfamily)
LPMRRPRVRRHAQLMTRRANHCTDRTTGAQSGAGTCAGLCTEEGLAAIDRAYRVRLLARARLVVVDPDLAEEAVQEALLRAWRSCPAFDPATGPPLNWLLAITRNVAIDLARARGRRPPLVPPPAEQDAPVGGISATDLVVLRTQLREALTGIGAEQRMAIVETILRDRPPADVAAELGIPAGTVRTRVHYGLRQLRGLLEVADAA